jgi:outer membrane protein insertion porin family
MQWRKPAVAGLLLIILCCISLPAAADEFDGLPITRIVMKDDRGVVWPDAANLLPLAQVKVGDPFSRDAVRRGIGYIYLKRLFRDVRVDAFHEDGGVRLEYTLFPVTIVDRIVLRGNHCLGDREVLAALPGVEGRELREEAFPDLRTNIQTRYQDDGFYNALVNFRVEPTKTPYRADLYVYITEPKRTVIEDVRFLGNTVFSPDELLEVMKNRPGRPLLTNVLLDDDLQAIRKKYADAGYPSAKTGPVNLRFRDDHASIEIGGTEGTKVITSFTGNEEFSDEKLRDMLLIWSEHDISDTVVQSSVDKIRNAYRDKGYADAAVEVRRTEGQGAVNLAFTIHEGPRVLVDDIRVKGNRAFSAKEIRAMMATQVTHWYTTATHLFSTRTDYYREDVLDNDVGVINDRYVADGYLSAEVNRTVLRSADGRKATIVITVDEGTQTVTGKVTFAGNVALGDRELRDLLKLRTGMPFDEQVMDEDRYRIVKRYADKGYLYARVDAEKRPVPATDQPAPSSAVMDVVYRIVEDQQVRMGTVVLRGNLYTKDYVILRELQPATGQPYNYEAILKSQLRVYRYGYFSQAKFEPVHPFEKEAVKDMVFTVEERPAGSVEFGVGYGNLDRLRGFLEVSHRNIEGTGRYASIRLEGSDILQRAALTIQEPWFMGFRNVDGRFLLAWSDSKRINQDTRQIYYQTRKSTASYGIERTDGGLKSSLTYQFENVTNYNVLVAAELTPEDTGNVLISSLSPAVVWDLRDDPFNPTRGSVHGATLKEAMKPLGSDADFSKATVQTTWYFPAAERTVLALSSRAGMAWPHRDTVEVPLHERFYLGGGTTVRGYTQDSVGPQGLDAQGNKVPTGGNSMVQLNAETRMNAAGGSGIVFFVDAGNVWVDRHIRLDDLRASYGAGLRYATPVGPLRLDYGQKIHRRPGESPGELHFSIGQAF